jgi:hypothetical protein
MLRRSHLAAALAACAAAFIGSVALAEETVPAPKHLPPAHPQHNRHAGSRLAHHHRGPAHEFGQHTQTPKPD